MKKRLENKLMDYKEYFENQPFMYTEQEDVDFIDEVHRTILKLESKVDNLLLIIALLILFFTVYICCFK